MPEWLVDVIKLSLVAGASAYITVHLSLNRFYKEKWWEKKHEIYTRLFEAIHHQKKFFNLYLQGTVIKEKKEELTAKFKAFTDELHMLNDLARFQLSDNANTILTQYQNEMSDSMHKLLESEDLTTKKLATTFSEISDSYLNKLSTEARQDLKID